LYFLLIGLLFSFTGLSQSCLPGGIIFNTQAQIDNFQTTYPGCTEIEGFMTISGIDITNLSGLSVLTSIGDYFQVIDNDALASLTALKNIAFIGGYLSIYRNPALTSLTGLDNLTSIGGDLAIGYNNALTSLMGLENLASIGGYLWIDSNDDLLSITGLANVDAGSIINLTIINNHYLSTCEAQSICDFLASPNGIIVIQDNAYGCNSLEEVEAACGLGLNESGTSENLFYISPNPSSTQITIKTSAVSTKFQFSIFNQNGREVIRRQITESRTVVDMSELPGGVYFVRMTGERTVSVERFIKTVLD
jgi:hypothetical protein